MAGLAAAFTQWEQGHFGAKKRDKFIRDAERLGWDKRTMVQEAAKRGLHNDDQILAYINSAATREADVQQRISQKAMGLERPLTDIGRGGVETRSVSAQLADISRRQAQTGIAEPMPGAGMPGEAPEGTPGAGMPGADVWPQQTQFEPGVRYGLREPSVPTQFSPEAAGDVGIDPNQPLQMLKNYVAPGGDPVTDTRGADEFKMLAAQHSAGIKTIQQVNDEAVKLIRKFRQDDAAAKAAGLERESAERRARTQRPATPKTPMDYFLAMQDNVRDLNKTIAQINGQLADAKLQIIEVGGMQRTRAQAEAQRDRLTKQTLPTMQRQLRVLAQRAGMPVEAEAPAATTGTGGFGFLGRTR